MNFDEITHSVPWVLPVGTFFFAISLILLVVVGISALQDRQYLQRHEALQNYVFPQSYFEEVRTRYPHLTEANVAIAFEQLRLYFSICLRKEPKTVAMPSKLVDLCWHVFITDTRHYQRFCNDVYGRFLHHMPRVEVYLPQDEKTEEGMTKAESKEAKELILAIKAQELDAARIYHWAVALQVPVEGGHLVSTDPGLEMPVPLLFSIDQDMRIPEGYIYSPEVMRFLANYDLKAAESAAASLDSSAGGSLGTGCGDGGVACGGSGGSV
jgi:hypothetical protein